jgi:hypothetical protein
MKQALGGPAAIPEGPNGRLRHPGLAREFGDADPFRYRGDARHSFLDGGLHRHFLSPRLVTGSRKFALTVHEYKRESSRSTLFPRFPDG